MGQTGATLAKVLGSVLFMLAFSNLLFAALNHLPLAAALGPALFVAALGALAWWWALRAAGSAVREGPNTIWIAAAKIVGTVSILYGLGIELLFTAVGRADLATGSLTLFGGVGIALWVWALYAGRTSPFRGSPAGAWSFPLPPPPPPYGGPLASTPSPSTPPPGVDLAVAYREVDQEGTAAYGLARTMSARVVYAHVIIALATVALAFSPFLVFHRGDVSGLTAPAIVAFYFGLSAFLLWRKFAWVDHELRSGRIPSEADLGGGIFHSPQRRAEGAGPTADPTPDAIPPEASVFSRTLVMLQFGRHMARDARQFAFVLLVFGFTLGSIAAWVVTFGSLMAFAGGTAFLARDAAAAWGAAGLSAVIVLALLYPVYAQIDRIDRRYRTLETTVGELERAFWSRF